MIKESGIYELSIAALLFASFPLFALIGGGASNPFLYLGIWSFAMFANRLFYIWRKHPYFYKKEYCKEILRIFINKADKHNPNKDNALSIFDDRTFLLWFGKAEVLLLAWALVYIPDVIVAVVFEGWPILLIIVLAWKDDDKEYHFPKRTIPLFALSMAFTATVIFSGTGHALSSGSSIFEYILGCTLVTLSLLFQILPVPRINQSKRILTTLQASYEKEGIYPTNEDEEDEALVGIFIALQTLSTLGSGILGFALYFIFKIFGILPSITGGITLFNIICIAIGGYFVSPLAEYFWTSGTYKGKNLSVQSIAYLTPVLGTCLLISYEQVVKLLPVSSASNNISNVNWILFIIGLAGVVVTTIYINYRVTKR